MKASTIVDSAHVSNALGIAQIAERLTVWGMMTKRQAAAFETETLVRAPCDVTISMRQRKGQAHVTLDGAAPYAFRIKHTGEVLAP